MDEKMEELMVEIRDALNANAAQTAKLADAMAKLARCVDEKDRLKVIEGKEYKSYTIED